MSKKIKFGVNFTSKCIATATIPDNIKNKKDAAKYLLENWQTVPLDIDVVDELTELDESVKVELCEEEKHPKNEEFD